MRSGARDAGRMKITNPLARPGTGDPLNGRAAVSSSYRADDPLIPPLIARRSFLRRLGLGAVARNCARSWPARIRVQSFGRQGRRLSKGDTAILQFLAAAEIIETDLWQQYTELGGQDSAESGYRAALEILDEDQPQYISDNTDDEQSHVNFLNAYLHSKGSRG